MAKPLTSDLRLSVLFTSIARSQRKRVEGSITAVDRHLPSIRRWRGTRHLVEAVVEDLERPLSSDPVRTLSPPCIVAYLPDWSSESLKRMTCPWLGQLMGSLTPPTVLASRC